MHHIFNTKRFFLRCGIVSVMWRCASVFWRRILSNVLERSSYVLRMCSNVLELARTCSNVLECAIMLACARTCSNSNVLECARMLECSNARMIECVPASIFARSNVCPLAPKSLGRNVSVGRSAGNARSQNTRKNRQRGQRKRNRFAEFAAWYPGILKTNNTAQRCRSTAVR